MTIRIEKSLKMHLLKYTVQLRLDRLVVYFAGSLFPKKIRVVRKRLFEFFTFDSNPPLVNPQQISTRVGCHKYTAQGSCSEAVGRR